MCTFSIVLYSPSTQLPMNMLGYSSLWSDSFFSDDLLRLKPYIHRRRAHVKTLTPDSVAPIIFYVQPPHRRWLGARQRSSARRPFAPLSYCQASPPMKSGCLKLKARQWHVSLTRCCTGHFYALASLWRVSMRFCTTLRSIVIPMIVKPTEPDWKTIWRLRNPFQVFLSL